MAIKDKMSFKEVAEFISENIMGCKFVGISNENEVFVTFDHDDLDLELAAARYIRRKFSYVSKVTTVVKPSIGEVTKMVDELNKLLDDSPSDKNDLLDIGSF